MTARKPLSILAALGLAASLVLAGCGSSAAPADTATPETEAVATPEAATVSVQVVVEDATVVSEDGAEVEPTELEAVIAEVPEGGTVLDALTASGIEFESEDSEYGAFVTSIAGVAGTDSTGWVYTVNGEEIMESADAHVVEGGDVITWSLIAWE